MAMYSGYDWWLSGLVMYSGSGWWLCLVALAGGYV